MSAIDVLPCKHVGDIAGVGLYYCTDSCIVEGGIPVERGEYIFGDGSGSIYSMTVIRRTDVISFLLDEVIGDLMIRNASQGSEHGDNERLMEYLLDLSDTIEESGGASIAGDLFSFMGDAWHDIVVKAMKEGYGDADTFGIENWLASRIALACLEYEGVMETAIAPKYAQMKP